MRWFVVFLLIANIGLYFWVQHQSRPLPAAPELPPPDIGRLQLAAENAFPAPADLQSLADAQTLERSAAADEPSSSAADDAKSQSVARVVAPVPSPEIPAADRPNAAPGAGPAPATDGGLEQSSEDRAAAADATERVADPEVGVPLRAERAADSDAGQTVDEVSAVASTAAPGPPSSASALPDADSRAQQEAATRAPPNRARTGEAPSRPAADQAARQPSGQPAASSARSSTAESGVAESGVAASAAGPSDGQPPGEQRAGQGGRSVSQAANSEESVAVPSDDLACFKLGPLDEGGAERLRGDLPAGFELLADEVADYPHIDGYYVMIPPLPSREAGLEKLEQLTAAGITDTWLFRRGPFRNGISLGLFSREARAERHASNIELKGFTVAVQRKTSTRQGHWLSLRRPALETPETEIALPDGVTAAPEPCPD